MLSCNDFYKAYQQKDLTVKCWTDFNSEHTARAHTVRQSEKKIIQSKSLTKKYMQV